MGQMVNGEPSVVNKLQGFYVERTQATRLVTRTPFHTFSWIMLTAAPVLASVNLIKIFTTTDFVGQAITVGLALFSIVAWTVMFGKFSELKRLRELNLAFEQRLRDERTLLDLP
ncbi:MAG: hypothetical protein RIQ79_540, partial [Verrucomicrobiota bacterium]